MSDGNRTCLVTVFPIMTVGFAVVIRVRLIVVVSVWEIAPT